jgi:hypothetical protein
MIFLSIESDCVTVTPETPRVTGKPEVVLNSRQQDNALIEEPLKKTEKNRTDGNDTLQAHCWSLKGPW